MNQPTPEYITTQLSNILTTLQQDINANNTKHHHELTVLRQIIQAKDEEINSLNQQLRKYQQSKRQLNKESASFKKITLAKKGSKNVTHFTSQLSNANMAESVLVDQQVNHNQNTKSISKPSAKGNSSIANIKTPRLPKSKVNDKQNIVLSVKKLSVDKTKRRSNSSHQQPQPQDKYQKTSSKKLPSKQMNSSEKRCINIVIPTANFSAYTIKTSKTNASQSANVC